MTDQSTSWEKPPGWDWTVGYEFEGEPRDEMLVFGCVTAEDALREARYSLDGADGTNVGTYAILSLRRVDP